MQPENGAVVYKMPLPGPQYSYPSLPAGILNNSVNTTINNGNFQVIQHNHYPTDGRIGLMMLYEASIPEAAHDSSARKYAAKCYPGTREQHIQDFLLWVAGASHGQYHRFRMFWMNGPFGVGKSAIAQTCAERIERQRLGAAFFFSMPNQRDDPDRFFPSIAYQISMQNKLFADLLNAKIGADPSILTKTIQLQFQELIVSPTLELREQGVEISEKVVIIDGLDECRDNRAQCLIIELISTAVREYGERLPFLWAFFSRPEPHILETFSSETISPFFWKKSVFVSRELDKEIELYLRGEFENIRKRKHIPSSSDTPWPSDEDISKLVDKTDGLYVYASTVTKYIGDPDALDPRDRLETIISLRLHRPFSSNVLRPTAELDSLYTLVMRRIPPHILPLTQQILLLNNDPTGFKAFSVMLEILGLSLLSATTALSKLHSVLVVPDDDSGSLKFHHASFMEFLWDITRSGPGLCIELPQHYERLLKRGLLFIEGFEEIPAIRQHSEMTTRQKAYFSATFHIPGWIQLARMDGELADLLASVDFAKHAENLRIDRSTLEGLFEKLPLTHRDQVIRGYQPNFSLLRWLKNDKRSMIGYILGQGKKSVRYEFDDL